MGITEEGSHTAPDGKRLYTKTWKTEGPPKALLAFVHGFSDHCNAYYDFFPTLASYGIEVRAFDQRGWGRSVTTPSTRGLTGPTATVMSDINSFLSAIYESLRQDNANPTPVFLMGHSMGGGEVLYYVLNSAHNLPPLRGVLAYSPLVALHPSTRPWALTVSLGKLASKVAPNHQLCKPLDPALMCRDERVCKEWKEDPLCHDTGTLEGLAGMLDRAKWLEKGGSKLNKLYKGPIWIGHGTADQINSFDASRLLSDRLTQEDKTFRAYEDAYHKLHVEPEGVKEAFAKDVAEWILERCGRADSVRPSSAEDTVGEGIVKPKL